MQRRWNAASRIEANAMDAVGRTVPKVAVKTCKKEKSGRPPDGLTIGSLVIF